MKGLGLIFLSTVVCTYASTCPPCTVFCARLVTCPPDEKLLPRDPAQCRCCNTCVPIENQCGHRGLYDPCDNNKQCKSGLKCGRDQHVCVNKSCSDECRVKCATVDRCTEPGTYKHYFACGCCSTCAKYLEIGDDCSDPASKCCPKLECCEESHKCVEKSSESKIDDEVEDEDEVENEDKEPEGGVTGEDEDE